ncbi:hypothetical protein HDU87_004193 [Geranomyces variabilis]|uniref:LicD/FKTN/FKRP nucleotidyltransferase domain-containing protein n=1 Tax=Geranomyces variabilis TaxID=109894 RepID=A0AAD5TK27_9FUNG|nr:hypothetical protein HDU87_004193 [Geranomyces variabilis]
MHFHTARRHSRRVLALLAAACVGCLFLVATRRESVAARPQYHRVRLADPIPDGQRIQHPQTVPPDPRWKKQQHQQQEQAPPPPSPPLGPLFYTAVPGLLIPYPTILAPVPTTPNATVAGAYPPIYDANEMVRPMLYQSEIPMGATLLLTPDEYAIPHGRGPKPPKGPDGKPVRGKKYFYEKSNHFDARWFVAKTPDELRGPLIKNLFAAWSRFADERQVPYWIMHGSLLGWYFGGRQMPWDDDMDIQVNANMLYVLAQYNMTRGTGNDMRYILDVNPNHTTRHHEKSNVIDARFIDTHTGHFIDITGLAFPEAEDEAVMCKTPHRYRLDQIYPLVRTLYEGVQTWRPHAVADLLRKEYGPGVLNKMTYNRHRFDLSKNRWVKDLSLPPMAAPQRKQQPPIVPLEPSRLRPLGAAANAAGVAGGALKLTPVTTGSETRFVPALSSSAEQREAKEEADAARKLKEADDAAQKAKAAPAPAVQKKPTTPIAEEIATNDEKDAAAQRLKEAAKEAAARRRRRGGARV